MAASKSIDRRYVENCARVIRTLFDESGKKQQGFADAIGLSQTFVSDMLNNKPTTGIGAQALIALRDFTGMTIDELLGLDAPKRSRRRPDGETPVDAGASNPFRVGAEAAMLDGATHADVAAARETVAELGAPVTWRDAYGFVMEAMRERVAPIASLPPAPTTQGIAKLHDATRALADSLRPTPPLPKRSTKRP